MNILLVSFEGYSHTQSCQIAVRRNLKICFLGDAVPGVRGRNGSGVNGENMFSSHFPWNSIKFNNYFRNTNILYFPLS